MLEMLFAWLLVGFAGGYQVKYCIDNKVECENISKLQGVKLP